MDPVPEPDARRSLLHAVRHSPPRWLVAVLATGLLLALTGVVYGANTNVSILHLTWSELSTSYGRCEFHADKDACLHHAMATSISDRNPVKDLARMDSIEAINNICHTDGHWYGRRWAQHRPLARIRPVLAQLEGHKFGSCTRGFVHGVEEVGLQDGANFDYYAAQLCTKLNGTVSLDCFHGLGHGLILQRVGVPAATARCQTLPLRAARVQCTDGIQMQLTLDRQASR